MIIRLRDKCQCQICGFSPPLSYTSPISEKLNIDHIFPKSIFAFSHPYNLQVLCSDCNFDKSYFVDEIQFRMYKNAYIRTNILCNEKFINMLYESLKYHYKDKFLNYKKWGILEKEVQGMFLNSIKTSIKKKKSKRLEEIFGYLINEKLMYNKNEPYKWDGVFEFHRESELEDKFKDLLKKFMDYQK
tara:strand:- start:507 stop:1067 length:561 start_codon:yes stop_codon:yes gene_type:complete